MFSPIENALHGPDAQSDLHQRMQRLCALLGIAGARFARLTPAGYEMLGYAGRSASNLDQLDAQTIAGDKSQVLADTAAMGMSAARFYAGILVHGDTKHASYMLSLFDTRPRTVAMAANLANLAQDVATQALIDRQRREIDVRDKTIADYQAVEEHRRSLFDRASATARIGIWHCNLSDNTIVWTNGVYDLFEIPRNEPVTREIALPLYTDKSRREMENTRATAIANCTDFSIDCEIITTLGKRRWMRVTGAVESRNGVAHRIFGMKQDITEEKLLADRTRYLAEFDVMTGLANRSVFQVRLTALDTGLKTVSAMLLIDLDGFKQVNDTYGHALGDECLKEAARRLMDSCGDAELVARIGGDEFAVLLGAELPAAQAKALAEQIVLTIGRPFTINGQLMTIGASVGAAHYNGGSSESLFRQADMALYEAKAAGRNTSRAFNADAA